MIYSRGSPYDFESWPVGWKYVDLISHFESIEQRLFHDDIPANTFSDQEPETSSAPALHPLSRQFLVAGQQAGYGLLLDRGIEAKAGVCPYQRTQRNGRRQTSFSVFLKGTSVQRFENATVEKILLRDQKAVGIQVRSNNEVMELQARKGIVLSAGAIHSPLILQRSGIGPLDILRQAGIDPKVIIPQVGENLQDHLIFPLIYAASGIESMGSLRDRSARVEYARYRTGPLASNIAEVGGFGFFCDRTDRANQANRQEEAAAPDFQWHFTPTHYLEYPTSQKPQPAWTIGITLLHPLSRGKINIVPGDPFCPSIDPAYLSVESDLRWMVEAIGLSENLADQPALASYRSERIVPGSKKNSHSQREAAVCGYATTIFHPMGTCAIGSPGQSVVDDHLRVHGIEHLFVADASVIPSLPSANPQAIVMMIGCRMASMLSG